MLDPQLGQILSDMLQLLGEGREKSPQHFVGIYNLHLGDANIS